MTKTTRREAFERYRPLVTKIALGIGRGVPKHIPREDLISAGNLGLVQAMRHWTPDANPDGFRLYASSRIRGAVLDELRGADPLSRRDRQAISRVNQAERAHRARLGQSVPPHTIATRCGLDETEYHRLKCAELAAQPTELHESECWSRYADIPALCDARFLLNLTRRLSPRSRQVIEARFKQDRSLREISETLGVSESRAHQLLSRALEEMRDLISDTEPSRAVGSPRQVSQVSQRSQSSLRSRVALSINPPAQ